MAHAVQTPLPTAHYLRSRHVYGRHTARAELVETSREEPTMTHLLTQALESRIELFPAIHMSVHQEIQHVDRLHHTIEGRQVALGRREVVPASFTSNPDLNTAILRLAVSVMSNIVDDNAIRGVVPVEDWIMRE